ncbi:MAG: PhoD-like phosphatase [Cyanobacteria bacterium J083]|nr:MAG: PhoD-like phosphatase [Cyanobacteria bacterium J083]
MVVEKKCLEPAWQISKYLTEYLPKIENLPLILAGPILRRTEPDSVTVWLALTTEQLVHLEIYQTQNQGARIDKLLLTGQRQTIQLGKHLHIVAVTAQSIENNLLQAGKIYAYNIYFNSNNGDRHSLIAEVENNQHNLSYFPHQLPTFSLSPQNLNHLKIVHGSCRKPHGEGQDTLYYLDKLIEEASTSPYSRPHQLFLTGDQIYGDDVADSLLWWVQGINHLLFGWSEDLPLKQGSILADELLAGTRSEIARIEGGLTAMLRGKHDKAKSHLFSFGEYAITYLLAWSPILMPNRFPEAKSLFKQRQQIKRWQKETNNILSFIKDLGAVRRALANIPVYTICDDHDISDDWYLNREWCERVLSKPLGKRIVQNGLLSYALFQAWGNTPKYFEAGTAGDKLLHYASRWLTSQGKDCLAKEKCDKYLGIPTMDSLTGLPKLEKDENVLILARDRFAIPWNYIIRSNKHEVIVLDTRTWRGYPQGKNQQLEPPMLLSPRAFKQQLQKPLRQSNPEIEVTIVVLPTNLVTLRIIDWIQQFALSRDQVFSTDVGDSWNFNTSAFAQLLLTFCQHRDQVIIFSGDIHYSCALRLTHWFSNSLDKTVVVQLTSSAIKNSEFATRLIHTKLKSLLPEKTQIWLGWEKPFRLKQVNPSLWQRNNIILDTQQDNPPAWQYQIEWCHRQPAQPLSWQPPTRQNGEELKMNPWQKLLVSLIYSLWRNRWLQEGKEVIGRNNLSLVKFQWSTTKVVIQETYWQPPWNRKGTVKSCYKVSLEP